MSVLGGSFLGVKGLHLSLAASWLALPRKLFTDSEPPDLPLSGRVVGDHLRCHFPEGKKPLWTDSQDGPKTRGTKSTTKHIIIRLTKISALKTSTV